MGMPRPGCRSGIPTAATQSGSRAMHRRVDGLVIVDIAISDDEVAAIRRSGLHRNGRAHRLDPLAADDDGHAGLSGILAVQQIRILEANVATQRSGQFMCAEGVAACSLL